MRAALLADTAPPASEILDSIIELPFSNPVLPPMKRQQWVISPQRLPPAGAGYFPRFPTNKAGDSFSGKKLLPSKLRGMG